MIITIDGPASSGKSTVAHAIARARNLYYLNSGLLYRALAYLLLHKRTYTTQELRVPHKTDIAAFTDPKRLKYTYESNRGPLLTFDGQDITPFLKDPDVDNASSLISQDPRVRDRIYDLQHAIAEKYPLIIEGRDAGSVVFPQADYKLFLTASVDKRAERWRKQQAKKGRQYSIEQAIEHVTQRDERDEKRKIAPLIIPEGAIVVDNSALTKEQTLKEVLSFLNQGKA